MFKLENLPKDIRQKVNYIEFYDTWERENTGNMGVVFLKDEFEFDWDNSHTTAFDSRNDLIDIVRNSTICVK